MKKFVGMICLTLLTACMMSACGEAEEPTVSGGWEKIEESSSETNVVENEEKQTEASETENTEAVEESSSEGGKQETADGFSYADLKYTEFTFSSGVGAWQTSLQIAEDGSFTGFYSDADMGVTGPGYPNGTLYLCSFTGKFGKLVKVDDLTYKTKMESISFERTPGEEEIVDETLYIYTEAYGMDNANDFYFYLPGTRIENFNEEMMSWIYWELYDYDTEETADAIDFVALFNETPQYGFYSNNIVKSIRKVMECYEEMDAEDDARLRGSEHITQVEMNQMARDSFDRWDYVLNRIWKTLTSTKTGEEMDKIRAEEREWVAMKEAAVKEAGADYEGGSMQPLVEWSTASELTKKRVYELVEYLD